MRAVVLLLFAGCTGAKLEDSPPPEGLPDHTLTGCFRENWYPDQDGDGHGNPALFRADCEAPEGYVASHDDCDDADVTTYTGAPEHCDGVDHDCDGLVNEDDSVEARPWLADEDADSWGGGEPLTVACAGPEGSVSRGGDCDDTTAEISPDEPELCNEIDDDCDGLVDDADTAVAGTSAWYVDEDLDGRGDTARSPTWACVAPEGLVADHTDCDDRDAAQPAAWYPDEDGDGWGADSEPAYLCEQPARSATYADDCDDADPRRHPGAAETDCEDPTDWNCDGHAGGEDGDGDGWMACEECDDGDPTVSPLGVEACNARDDDCDGVVDDHVADAPVWYRDADGDGYGDPAGALAACAEPPGYGTDATDCNDAESGAHPGLREMCRTDFDDDCDGLVDAVGATGCVRWYADLDGDGYGGIDSTQCTCAAQEPYVQPAADDCDDASPEVNPGSAEIEHDGIDQDCDGYDITSVDLEDTFPSADGGSSNAAPVGERLELGDLDGDGAVDLVVGIGAFTSRATPMWVTLPTAFVDGTLVASGADRFTGNTGPEGDFLGLAPLRDLDGDGAVDLLVSQCETPDRRGQPGVVWLQPGPLRGSHSYSDASLEVAGDAVTADFGAALGAAADLDGDGLMDLPVGAPGAGTVQLLPAAATGAHTSGEYPLALSDARGDLFGSAVHTETDVNGDGLVDLLVGASDYGSRGSDRGGIFVFVAPVSLPADESSATALVQGVDSAEGLGGDLSSAGDFNEDGLGDVLAVQSRFGGAYVLTALGTSGTAPDLAWLTYTDGVGMIGDAVAGADLDGDGRGDLALARQGPGYADEWTLAVVFGPGSGSYSTVDFDALCRGGPGAGGGQGTLAAGDVDADGRAELYFAQPWRGTAPLGGQIWRLDGSTW